MRKSAIGCVIVAWLCMGGVAAADDSFAELSLDQLLNLDLSVVTKTKMTARESPGIVTLVTAEEIAATGARDLIDVLMLVPGFQFGVDVQSTVGAGIRGLWGHEGKILLLVDGQEMNEILYSTLQFGNHFPVNQIARIEIIRGPGSAVYGGFAELAVINIVTRSAEDPGFRALLTAGEMSDTYGRRTLDLSWAGKVGEWGLAVGAFVGQGNRSDGTYTDALGESVPMAENAELDPGFYNVGMTYKGLDARIIVDRYHMTQRDLFGENLPEEGDLDFDSYYASVAYPIEVNERFTLTPKIQYKQQRPWQEFDEILYYDKTSDRSLANLTATWQASDSTTLLGGIEYTHDRGRCAEAIDPADCFETGRNVSYDNLAAFAQASFETRWANLTIGARYEDHDYYGSSFVPRLGLTKVIDKFHFKILAARAFRGPGLENIHFGYDIEPEETTAYELEAGLQIGDQSLVTLNLFDLKIDEPIVYFADSETNDEGYANFDRTGSRGGELEYRLRGSWGYATFGYSYYQANDNQVAAYGVPGDEDALLAFARHKLALVTSFRLGKTWRLTPSIIHRTGRWAWTGYDADGNGILEELDDVTLINVYLAGRDVMGTGLEVGIGVFDLLDEGEVFPQPYDSGHPPMPGPSREYVLRIGYRLGGG